jgi:23S rRNA pseudouridine2605 synthase
MNWRKKDLNPINTFDEDETQDVAVQDVRLQTVLSSAGLCSRRTASDLLRASRITVNGTIIREPGFRVRNDDVILIDGKEIKRKHRHVYLAINKPVGYVCSNADPEGRKILIDLFSAYKDVRLFSVGRLDFLSSGLIFFTNDGAFANLVSHPRNGFEKEYFVETKKNIPIDFLEEFKKGIYAEGERYRIKSYRILNPSAVSLVLNEGKNKEIRNAFAARKHTIKKLHRVRIGSVQLGNLETGKYRILSKHEIEWFYNNAQGVVHGNRT